MLAGSLPSAASAGPCSRPTSPTSTPPSAAAPTPPPTTHRPRQGNPGSRPVTTLRIRYGLRVSDALKLPVDCTVPDDSGAPYLRYFNHKMKREALVPIDDELAALIRGQQRVLARYRAGI